MNMLEISLESFFNSVQENWSIAINLQVTKPQIIGIYGESGVGKTTFLKTIAGLQQPRKGKINLNGNLLLDSKNNISLPSKKRKIAFVFQDYNLFPHMSVAQNIKFSSGTKSMASDILNLIEEAGIKPLLNKKPKELSGGQKQRAAILKAFAQEAEIVLMDEPFSAVDDDTCDRLIQEILRIQIQKPKYIFVVSHRKQQLKKLCGEILVLKKNEQAIMIPSVNL